MSDVWTDDAWMSDVWMDDAWMNDVWTDDAWMNEQNRTLEGKDTPWREHNMWTGTTEINLARLEILASVASGEKAENLIEANWVEF